MRHLYALLGFDDNNPFQGRVDNKLLCLLSVRAHAVVCRLQFGLVVG